MLGSASSMLLSLALILGCREVSGQESVPDSAGGVRALTAIGSIEEDLTRVRQLLGEPSNGYQLRSLSRQSGLAPGRGGLRLGVLLPQVEATWNSDIPSSMNEGMSWSGRGVPDSKADISL